MSPRTFALLFAAVSAGAAPVPGERSGFHEELPAMSGHTAIWTGSAMIVWGTAGVRYDPASDTWTSLAPGPSPRVEHVAVWTGAEMVVWGGIDGNGDTDEGGRYDPDADTWVATSTTAAPSPRAYHAGVWTGRELVVWGGYKSGTGSLADGARYDPATDAWTPTTMTGAPAGMSPTAVWTGNEMIVWGFAGSGRYDPSLDSWRTVSATNAPQPRYAHTAVFTGTEMIVWGGSTGYTSLNNGGRYDPATDTWRTTSVGLDVPTPRGGHGAIWAGTEMIVWGGPDDTGGRYDPVADTWRPTATTGAPAGRGGHSTIWTGGEMIVWGGNTATGGRYDPAADAWEPTDPGSFVPESRSLHTAVWTGAQMVVWGGKTSSTTLATGGRYTPATDSWLATSSTGAPSPLSDHVAVWTGTEMIVWGAIGGGRYDPAGDVWGAPVSGSGAPYVTSPAAVYTGSEMIVWGSGSSGQAAGARYVPATDTWTPMNLAAPGARDHTAIWTGNEMIVFGLNGHRYAPAADAWQATSTVNAPSPRAGHSAIWTGSEMIVWGGELAGCYACFTRSGGRYDPTSDTWRPLSLGPGVPSARRDHTAVWTGSEMIVFGGRLCSYSCAGMRTGARYAPGTDTWVPTTTQGAPTGRANHTAVFDGVEMLVFGGAPETADRGARYDPATDTWNRGWRGPPLGGNVLVAKPPGGGSPFHGAGVRGYRIDGVRTPFAVSAYPEHVGFGARIGAGDVDAGGSEELLAAPGPGPTVPPRVRAFDRTGTVVGGFDFAPYGATGYGANVAASPIDAAVETLASPGPSPVYGPQVRAFRYTGGAVSPIAKVSFYAYGTLRFGTNVAGGDVDGDGYGEILTGAGPGVVFGPHVRGFDYDGAVLAAMPKVNFLAYGTPRYGVEVGAGDVEGDGFDEIVTGPGPSPSFSAQLRGFDSDGAVVTPIPGINAIVFSATRWGLTAAAGDLDGDGRSEITAAPGPDPLAPSVLAGFAYDGSTLRDLPALGRDVWGLTFGTRLAVGTLDY